MSFLQSALAALSPEALPDIHNVQKNEHEALQLIAAVSELIGLYQTGKKYKKIRERLQKASLTERLLVYLRKGKEVSEVEKRVFEKALILHMDHDFNASTFTARVVASSESRLASALSAAMGSLSGPLHGGANEAVIDMIEEIEKAPSLLKWLNQALAEKRKISGFGHRIYRTTDPRALLLEELLHELDPKIKDDQRFQILSTLCKEMTLKLAQKQKDYINPNVDFWSGLLYEKLEIEKKLFTPIFAAARVVGWSAHCLEQWSDNRIFRPNALYIGTKPEAKRKSS
jgi:citrate synthase